MFKCISLQRYFNNRGVTTEQEFKQGELSLAFSSFPQKYIPFNRSFTHSDIPFMFSKNNHRDNVEMCGQTIDLGEMYNINKIHFLGTSNNGDFSEDVHLYEDTSHVISKPLGFTDFIEPQPKFNEDVAIQAPYLHTRHGIKNIYFPIIWYNSINFNKSARANKLMFEDNPSIHIFCITIEVTI
ncbi:hypothetical protein [Bacillus sp. SM2101]|uniref:hypothetical protein n=1 Tax=Bacillus sp. SM2101 TaxID=2805366 RepID=UPI001BDEBD42|nr:hypothetical protein [Bacillus sp. SM2101]